MSKIKDIFKKNYKKANDFICNHLLLVIISSLVIFLLFKFLRVSGENIFQFISIFFSVLIFIGIIYFVIKKSRSLLENMTNVILPSIFSLLIGLFFISLFISNDQKILYERLTPILAALGGVGAAWGAFYAVEKSLAMREEDRKEKEEEKKEKEKDILLAKKREFFGKNNTVFKDILKFLYSDYPMFENAWNFFKLDPNVLKEEKINNRKTINDFYSKFSVFLVEINSNTNLIAEKYMFEIKSIIKKIISSDYQTMKIIINVNKDLQNVLKNIILQFEMFLEMIINLKEEDFISIISNQPFSDIDIKDTIKLLREKFPKKITDNCSEDEESFSIDIENFRPEN